VASILPYDGFDFPKIQLATKIGGEHKLGLISLHQWQKFAREVHIDADELVARLAAMAKRLPDEVNAARLSANKQGLNAPVIEKLAKQLTERAGACSKSLGAG
jgi:serine/threonine-protein kinase HipA